MQMRHYPLTQAFFVGFVFCHCGKDPILEAAENLEAEEAKVMEAPPAAGGLLAADGTITPGIPEEPKPGVPEDPPVAVAGAAGGDAGVPGQPGDAGIPAEPTEAGVPEEPEPGQPDEPKPGVATAPDPAPAGSTEIPEPPPGGHGEGQAQTPEPGIPEEPEPAPPGSPGGGGPCG